MRNTKAAYRILLGPQEIAGTLTRLNDALHDMDIDCDFLRVAEHPFHYPYKHAPNVKPLHAKAARVNKAYAHIPRYRIAKKLLYSFRCTWYALRLLWDCIAHYDAFVFIFGSTPFSVMGVFSHVAWLRYLDLKILHALKKTIVMLYCGDDSRPPYLSGSYDDETLEYSLRRCVRMRHNVQVCERCASVVVDNPAQAHFHKKPFVKLEAMGMPVDDLQRALTAEPARPVARDAVTILHCPSNKAAKGTSQIQAIIKNLRAKGHTIEFVQISGRPQAEVLRALADCDIVVDQLYSDRPMASFAIEASKNAKPVAIGGYFCTELQKYYEGIPLPPSCYCLPEQLEETIEKLVCDKAYRLDIGSRAKVFADTVWDAHSYAQRILMLLTNDIPSEWLCDPYTCDYIWGSGLQRDKVTERIQSIYSRYGEAALGIEDKPLLLEKYRALARAAH